MDTTLSLSTLITAATIIFTAGGFYYATRGDNQRMKSDITDIKADLKKLNDVIVNVALQNQRLDNQADRITSIEKRMDERLTAMEHRWDEVRRGEGLIRERA